MAGVLVPEGEEDGKRPDDSARSDEEGARRDEGRRLGLAAELAEEALSAEAPHGALGGVSAGLTRTVRYRSQGQVWEKPTSVRRNWTRRTPASAVSAAAQAWET